MRRAVTLVSLVAAAAAAGAGASTATDALVRPGKGIGKVNLGMTEAQVRRALGKPAYTIVQRAGFGSVRKEWQFGDGPAYTVTLVGPRGKLRVVAVATTLRRERTREGFGVGTLERRLAARYGSRFNCEKIPLVATGVNQPPRVLAKNSRECTVAGPTGTRTVFLSGLPPSPYSALRPDDIPRFRVIEVAIRAR